MSQDLRLIFFRQQPIFSSPCDGGGTSVSLADWPVLHVLRTAADSRSERQVVGSWNDSDISLNSFNRCFRHFCRETHAVRTGDPREEQFLIVDVGFSNDRAHDPSLAIYVDVTRRNCSASPTRPNRAIFQPRLGLFEPRNLELLLEQFPRLTVWDLCTGYRIV